MISGKIAAIVNMADDDIHGITREWWQNSGTWIFCHIELLMINSS